MPTRLSGAGVRATGSDSRTDFQPPDLQDDPHRFGPFAGKLLPDPGKCEEALSLSLVGRTKFREAFKVPDVCIIH